MAHFGTAECPHYHLVPKTLLANLRWRKQVLLEAATDPGFARTIRQMCADDILFYLNGFCWTYDPRDQVNPSKPFITYTEFQDDAILQMCDAINVGEDVALPKSRCMGASWMGLVVFEWYWHFQNDLSFLLISRNEKYVDESGNPKSLFWKIDYLHLNQPKWLLPNGRWLGAKDPGRRLLHLANADTGSVIDGESTTGDAGRGDRRTAMFVDEHAAFDVADGFKILRASRDTTKCRMFNSTPQGANNAFYEVVHKSASRVLRMHWASHPEYNRGLYTSENGKVKLLDEFSGMVKGKRKGWKKPKDFIYPAEYPFVLDGKIRSPWYDNECARCVSEMEIAQELDIDFLGSDYQFFDPNFIQGLVKEYCQPPLLCGDLIYESGSLDPTGFEINPKGNLELWFTLGGHGALLTDKKALDGRRFGLGTDVSLGTGSSNSVTAIVDLETGEKVGVWRDSRADPRKSADITIALAKWFNDGMMIWDATGAPGRGFTNRVLEKKYRKIYYRRSEGRVRERVSDQPGYFLNPEDRAVLFRDYRAALEERKYVNRSEPGMQETLQFIVQPGGKVEHSASMNSQDPRGARHAHGDEVVADALASRLLSISPNSLVAVQPKAPYLSPAWRHNEARLKLVAAENEDW